MAFYEALLVGPSQPHLPSADHRRTSNLAVPHIVCVKRRPPSNLAVIVDPSLARHPPPDGLPGLASTDERSVASWTRPHTVQSPTTAAYDLTPMPAAWPHSYNPTGLPGLGATDAHLIALWAQPHTSPTTTTANFNLPPTPVVRPRSKLPPTPVARPRSEYTAAAATANSTALATLFGPADLKALAYGPPTPSSVLSPATTDAHHGHAMTLYLTTELANVPASAAPISVQPRQLNRPSHVIHSTRPATPHSGPRKVMPETSVYAHATLVVVEYAYPEPLLRNDYLAD